MVPGCPYVRKRDRHVSFYRPPVNNEALMEQWAAVLGVSTEHIVKGDKRICDNHFKQSDFSALSSPSARASAAAGSILRDIFYCILSFI